MTRIQELGEQAKNSIPKDSLGVNEWIAAYNQKFAELIVKECADMAESFHRHQYDFTGNLELHEFIREHFGVEE